MAKEQSAPGDGGKTEFSVVRKGYDPVEVDEYLAEIDDAFRDLEEYVARLKHDLNDAKMQVARLEAAEQESIDNAMLAVFDAKDRIIKGAMEKARQIEEDARRSAGLPPTEPDTPSDTIPIAVGEEILAELSDVVGDDTESFEPNEAIEQLQREAESIRERLDDGLAAAFDQMEQMQRDAQARAEELLDAAREEARQLRAAGKQTQPAIEVKLTEEAAERPSRYSKNSAGLPRIGDDDGTSVLAKMNSLRARLRESEDQQDKESVS